jgi:hypothetical protein
MLRMPEFGQLHHLLVAKLMATMTTPTTPTRTMSTLAPIATNQTISAKRRKCSAVIAGELLRVMDLVLYGIMMTAAMTQVEVALHVFPRLVDDEHDQ